MKKRFLGLAILVASLVSIVSSQANVSSGLLLGLRQGDSYQTVWIAAQNGKIVTRSGADILVPRQSGWWRIGSSTASSKTQKGEVSTDQYLWAVPANSTSRGSKPSFEADCQVTQNADLLWVHEKYLAFENSGGGYCEGAAHPWAARVLEVRELDVLNRLGNTSAVLQADSVKVDIKDAINSAAQSQFVKAGEVFHKALPTGKQEVFESSPNTTNWALIRRSGQWVLRGRLGYSFEAARGFCCIDFDSGITPPKNLVGHDTLQISWKEIKTRYPNAIDAFSSPNKDLFFVLEKKLLRTFSVQGSKLGQLENQLSFKNNVSPVMLEWAVGNSVARWTKDTANYLK